MSKTHGAAAVPVERITYSILILHGQHRKYLPYAFTEHGAIMAATVLNSPRAVEMTIYVVRAVIQLREILASNKELAKRVDQLEARTTAKLAIHDQAIIGGKLNSCS